MNKDENNERTILGLLRLIGWQSGRDRELTVEDADLIADAAATHPVSEDDRNRLRERVMRKRFGTTAPAEEAEASPEGQAAKSLIALFKDESSMSLQEVSVRLELNPAFLLDLSDHSSLVPHGARREIARRADVALKVAASKTLSAFDRSDSANVRKAASRTTPFERQTITYEEIVKRSKLAEDQKRFWLELH